MRRIAKKYHPDRRIVVHSRAEIPTHFASEEAEREWWATHEIADELAPSEAEIDQMTEQHHALVRRLQKNDTQGYSRHPRAKRT